MATPVKLFSLSYSVTWGMPSLLASSKAPCWAVCIRISLPEMLPKAKNV